MKRTQLKRKTPLRNRSKLRIQGGDDTAEVKRRIQALLRAIAIRDGGCILRLYPESGACGGYRNDGQLILQAEHLVTRSNSVTFATSYASAGTTTGTSSPSIVGSTGS